jgi:feruloyl esterase
LRAFLSGESANRSHPAELRWDRLAGGPRPADLFLDEFRYVVYQDPNWDWRTFDLERDSAKAHEVD